MPERQHLPFLRLPLHIDLPPLLQDLDRCLQETWPDHFNARDYTGSWTVIALRSPGGDATQAYAHGHEFSDTPLMGKCPHIQALLAQLHCELEAVRLLRLAPDSHILTHTDQGLSYIEGTFRLHIPLHTQPEALFTIADQTRHLPAGTCWYGNFSLPHSVDNPGHDPRIHLVIDAHRNGWTDAWFRAAGMDIEAEQATLDAQLGPEHWRQVVQALELQGTEGARAVADSLRAQHGIV